MLAGLGTATPSKTGINTSLNRMAPLLARFVFKYRSHRSLQMLDLVPASPEPVLLEDRGVETLNLQEARTLVTQYRQKTHANGVKQEDLSLKAEETESTLNRATKRLATFKDDDECCIIEVKKCKTTNTRGAPKTIDLT